MARRKSDGCSRGCSLGCLVLVVVTLAGSALTALSELPANEIFLGILILFIAISSFVWVASYQSNTTSTQANQKLHVCSFFSLVVMAFAGWLTSKNAAGIAIALIFGPVSFVFFFFAVPRILGLVFPQFENKTESRERSVASEFTRPKMMGGSAGYVYVLINASMPGLVKIGKTKYDPHKRARDLSTTGVPTPFAVAYYQLVSDVDAAERFVHKLLSDHRESAQREFFRVSVAEAIQAVNQAAARYPEFES